MTAGPDGPSRSWPDSREAFIREELRLQALGLGITAVAFLPRRALPPFIARHPDASRRYGLDRAGLVMTAALAFGDGLGSSSNFPNPSMANPSPANPSPNYPSPLAMIGRFARANWYAELVERWGLCAKAARAALVSAGFEAGKAGDWHRLANSGLPERPLALASGLGSTGRSGLLLVPGIGPGLVLGLLLVPIEALGLDGEEALPSPEPRAAKPTAEEPGLPAPGSICGSCRACVEACPTGALGEDGSFDRESCIQHWSSREGELPPRVRAAWRDSLYGCDLCTVSCPRYSGAAPFSPSRGILGPGLPAASIASSSDEELRARLRGTALGMSWIAPEALRRNARLVIEKAGAHRGS